MARELLLITASTGLVVDADIFLQAAYITTVRLTEVTAGPTTTVYRGDMPAGRPAGKYVVVYRVQGDSTLQGPDIIHWNGSAEVAIASIAQKLDSARGSGFTESSDSLEAIRNYLTQMALAINNISAGGSGGGGLTDEDRLLLDQIAEYAKAAAANALGDFTPDIGSGTGTLSNVDGSEAGRFQFYNETGAPDVTNPIRRIRLT